MKRKLILNTALILSFMLFFNAWAVCQTIAITPAVCEDLPIPQNAKKTLNQKLLQIATQNGFGATGGPFVLTANVIEENKTVSGTIPAQFIVDLEVSVYIVNLTENILVAETSFNVRGMDVSENKAYNNAINRINARTPAVRQFMASSREKIIDYYAGRIPALIAKAQSLSDRGEYEEAISVLAVIPENLAEYPMVAEKMTALYTAMVDRYADMAIQDAKGKIALKNYSAAVDALMVVDPTSTRFSKASEMVESIKNTIDEKEKAEMQAKLEQIKAQQELAQKMHDDEVMLKKMQIEASQKTAESRMLAQTAGDVLQNSLSSWLFGNLKKK